MEMELTWEHLLQSCARGYLSSIAGAASCLPWAAYNASKGIRTTQKSEENAGHQYTYDIRAEDYTIRHQACKQPWVRCGASPRAVCEKCLLIQNDRGVIQMVAKFYLKHAAARVLALVV